MPSSGAARRSTGAGLYGSRIDRQLGRTSLTELIGTAVLVFVGTSAAVAGAATDRPVYDLLAVVLASG